MGAITRHLEESTLRAAGSQPLSAYPAPRAHCKWSQLSIGGTHVQSTLSPIQIGNEALHARASQKVPPKG